MGREREEVEERPEDLTILMANMSTVLTFRWHKSWPLEATCRPTAEKKTRMTRLTRLKKEMMRLRRPGTRRMPRRSGTGRRAVTARRCSAEALN